MTSPSLELALMWIYPRPAARLIFTIFIVLIFGVSCSEIENAKKDAAFQTLFPIEGMNSKLKFEKSNPNVPILNFSDPSEDSMSFAKPVKLMLLNQSDDYIQFPFPMNFHILSYIPGKNAWVENENSMRYFPPENTGTFLPKKQSAPLNFIIIVFEPQRNGDSDSNMIRVVAVGNIMKNEKLTGEQTAAYIDLELGY